MVEREIVSPARGMGAMGALAGMMVTPTEWWRAGFSHVQLAGQALDGDGVHHAAMCEWARCFLAINGMI